MTFQDSIKNNHACEGIVNISFKKGKRKSQSPSFLFKGKKKVQIPHIFCRKCPINYTEPMS